MPSGGFLGKDRSQLFTDGGARGNPGPAGIGFVLKGGAGTVVEEGKKFIGPSTNNAAEYLALILGLTASRQRQIERLVCYSDSELMVRQLNGQYRVKDPVLKKYFLEVKMLIEDFEEIVFVSIPRTRNKIADRLVNEAIDAAFKPL